MCLVSQINLMKIYKKEKRNKYHRMTNLFELTTIVQ